YTKSTITHFPRKADRLKRVPAWFSSTTPGTGTGWRLTATRRAVSLVKAVKPYVATASAAVPAAAATTLAREVRRNLTGGSLLTGACLQQGARDTYGKQQHGGDHQRSGNGCGPVIGQPFGEVHRVATWLARAPPRQEHADERQPRDQIDGEAQPVPRRFEAPRAPSGHVIHEGE